MQIFASMMLFQLSCLTSCPSWPTVIHCRFVPRTICIQIWIIETDIDSHVFSNINFLFHVESITSHDESRSSLPFWISPKCIPKGCPSPYLIEEDDRDIFPFYITGILKLHSLCQRYVEIIRLHGHIFIVYIVVVWVMTPCCLTGGR
jgi:hypothetical protein